MKNIIDSLMENYEQHQIEMINQSWYFADKETRAHRLHTIIALVLELENIKKVNKFSCNFGLMAIEAVIQGDWKELENIVEFQKFEGESKEIQENIAPLWETFRLIALTAIAQANGTLVAN